MKMFITYLFVLFTENHPITSTYEGDVNLGWFFCIIGLIGIVLSGGAWVAEKGKGKNERFYRRFSLIFAVISLFCFFFGYYLVRMNS